MLIKAEQGLLAKMTNKLALYMQLSTWGQPRADWLLPLRRRLLFR